MVSAIIAAEYIFAYKKVGIREMRTGPGEKTAWWFPLAKRLHTQVYYGVTVQEIQLTGYVVPVHKWLFYPNSSLLSKFNPRNINYMPVVKSIERLDLE